MTFMIQLVMIFKLLIFYVKMTYPVRSSPDHPDILEFRYSGETGDDFQVFSIVQKSLIFMIHTVSS